MHRTWLAVATAIVGVAMISPPAASARTIRMKCRDGAVVTSPETGTQGLPSCDAGASGDGTCIFEFECSVCRSCTCPLTLTPCDPNQPVQLALAVGERLVVPGCRARRVPRLVLRCRPPQ